MNTTLALLNLGGGEIILILAVVLILFGAKKLPELAKGLGTGIREFKKATSNLTSEISAPLQQSYVTPRPYVAQPSALPAQLAVAQSGDAAASTAQTAASSHAPQP
jgi:sec-independent protein translocase protein TatA